MNDSYSVMIVDDDPDLRHVLQSFLTSEGLVCETFSRAEEALEQLTRKPFDIMIADIIVPGMRGLELTERAKRIRPEMNIIVMTGYIENFSYDDAVAAGASDFIRKPFSLTEIALRLKHVRLQEKLRALSITDELTGLPNRRGFFALAEQQFKSAARSRNNLVLLFVDVDNFKRINDTWGHQTGDRALIAMAGILRLTVRDSDVIARMGGDEFAILFNEMPEINVRTVRERLEQTISEFNKGQDGSYHISVSIGTAIHKHDEPRTIDELLREADSRMYEEKQQKKAGF